nr:unnamed protein product [Callosobruchus analis]
MTDEKFDMYLCIRQAENHTDVVSDPWEYISCHWGPQVQEMGIAVSMTVINCIIFVSGLLGNIIVCIVITKHPSLNSPTDYYLLNLAISDVTLLVFGELWMLFADSIKRSRSS